MISELPGFNRVLLIPTADRREQELDEFHLRRVNKLNYVAQNHVRHSAWTADMCRSYGLTTIVLVRSLLDVIVSLRDHLRRESHIWPNFFAEPHHAALDDAALELMIARLALPWYVNFYMGWRQAPGALIVNYEDLIQEPARLVGDILSFSGASAAPATIQSAMDRVRGVGESRLNVGVIGRGSDLRPATIRAVLDLLDFYPEAAADPYIQAVRAQGLAALSGAPAPAAHTSPRAAAPPRARRSQTWLKKATRLVLIRRAAPMGLVMLAGLYWLWPSDLMPDSKPFGYLDDGLLVLCFAFLAGRLTRYKAGRKGLGAMGIGRSPARLPAAVSANSSSGAILR